MADSPELFSRALMARWLAYLFTGGALVGCLTLAFPHDAAAARAFIERDYDRAKNFASVTNHFSAAAGIDLSGRKIGMPLLVIHGSVDPIFPVEHGEALAASASGAKMVRIEGGGHEMHPGHWDLIIGEIGRHTAGAA